MPKIVAPYIACEAGDKGRPQRIVGRALARAGHGKLRHATRIRRKWDASLTQRLNEWRATVGIKNRDPKYTREDHRKLARWWDSFNHRLAADELASRRKETREQRIRRRVLAELEYLYNRRGAIAYNQARPYDRRRPPRRLDCSASKQWADEYAGAPTSGSPWGYGNTYTQLTHYRRIHKVIVSGRGSYDRAQPGDPVYYGAPSHVTVYLGNGRVFSFGSYPMKILPVDYRSDRTAICSLL